MNAFRCFGRTDPGLVRENNEDAFLASRIGESPMLLCAAIDGVGGYEGGEVAASVAAGTLSSYVGSHLGEKPLVLVKAALQEANDAVCKAKEARPDLSRMGCVASVALVDLEQRMAYIAHVGDTRIYLFGPEGLRKITHDHSLVGYMEDNGDITEFQAMNHPQRNEIERCLGISREDFARDGFVESGIYPIPPGGQLLLCSDGLTDCVPSREIVDVLSAEMDVRGKVDALIEAAKDKGGKDNITVVLLELPAEPVTPADTQAPAPSVPDRSGKRLLWLLPVVFLLGMAAGYLIGQRQVPEKELEEIKVQPAPDTTVSQSGTDSLDLDELIIFE